jgi:hypothetical protein
MREYERLAWVRAEPSGAEISALLGVGGGERRTGPFAGVPALMLAILEEAIRAYLGPVASCAEEAALWMADARRQWVFSFTVVCETLGLEPAAVRAAVRRMRQHRRPARDFGRGRSRPNTRQQAGLGIALNRRASSG